MGITDTIESELPPDEQPKRTGNNRPVNGSDSPFARANAIDVLSVLRHFGKVDGDRPICPGCGETGSSVAVVGNGLKCSHNRCSDKGVRQGFRTPVDVWCECARCTPAEAVQAMSELYGFEGFPPKTNGAKPKTDQHEQPGPDPNDPRFRDDEEAPNADEGKAARLIKISTADIFAELPPVPFVSRDLALCPGRPAELIGKAYTGKSYVGQRMLLDVAAGLPIWGHFPCTQGRVLHMDYEQGAYASRARYQWLLRGLNIAPQDLGDRLELVAKPRFYLTDSDALDVLCREVEGYSLVLWDALRGAIVDCDENDSRIRRYLDLAGTASEKTGACFLFIHHGGKGGGGNGSDEKDARDDGRGSSALFDAAGTVYSLSRSNGRINVKQTKGAPEARGKAADPFTLEIRDAVDEQGNPNGVVVEWVAPDVGEADPSRLVVQVAGEVRTVVEAAAASCEGTFEGCSGNYVRQNVKRKHPITNAAIEYAERRGWIRNHGGDKNQRWVSTGHAPCEP